MYHISSSLEAFCFFLFFTYPITGTFQWMAFLSLESNSTMVLIIVFQFEDGVSGRRPSGFICEAGSLSTFLLVQWHALEALKIYCLQSICDTDQPRLSPKYRVRIT